MICWLGWCSYWSLRTLSPCTLYSLRSFLFYCRHPSYVGWFWWSIGTQCILWNPLCVVAYAAASWKFFSERIYTEEMTLIKFFGSRYTDYQQVVGTGLPFIYGYTVSTPDSKAKKSWYLGLFEITWNLLPICSINNEPFFIDFWKAYFELVVSIHDCKLF